MALSLIVGPANAGKVELLLDRYLAVLDREPFLIVPGGADVERVERELLARTGALLAGSIGTFDDLFTRIAQGDPERPRRMLTDAQRALLVRRAIGQAELNGLGRSASFGGFGDSLLAALGELESALVEPDDCDGELGRLHAAYRRELERIEAWDRDVLRRRAAERLATDLSAWSAGSSSSRASSRPSSRARSASSKARARGVRSSSSRRSCSS